MPEADLQLNLNGVNFKHLIRKDLQDIASGFAIEFQAVNKYFACFDD